MPDLPAAIVDAIRRGACKKAAMIEGDRRSLARRSARHFDPQQDVLAKYIHLLGSELPDTVRERGFGQSQLGDDAGA